MAINLPLLSALARLPEVRRHSSTPWGNGTLLEGG